MLSIFKHWCTIGGAINKADIITLLGVAIKLPKINELHLMSEPFVLKYDDSSSILRL